MMIKKIILIFCVIFLSSLSLYSFNIKFYDEYSYKIVEKINNYRNSSFFERLKMAQIDFKDFVNSFSNYEYNSNLPELLIDEGLERLAKNRVIEIIKSQKIDHSYSSVSGYIFSGESICVLGFQNFIDIEDVVKVFVNRLIRHALLKDSSEAYFLNFPYQYIGIALGTTTIIIGDKKYNVYILVIEYGLTELQYNNEFIGRIFSGENICSNCEIKVFDANGKNIYNFVTNVDGSFYEFLPLINSKIYLQYKDKKYFLKFHSGKGYIINF